MKKTRTLICILLTAVLLCGCAGPEELYRSAEGRLNSFGESLQNFVDGIKNSLGGLFGFASGDPYAALKEYRQENIVSFRRMEYERPDVDRLINDVSDLEDALDRGKMSLNEIMDILDCIYDDYYNFSTMETLADIRSCLDLKDDFYSEEYAWCEEQSAVVGDMMDEMYFACGGSDYAEDLEREYFWEGFAEEYADESDSMYTPELVELMQQESDLLAEYGGVLADATVSYNGREMSFDSALELAIQRMEDEDYSNDSIYNYYDVIFGYYEKYNAILGDVFIRLIHVRNEMAQEAGYDNYEQMQYEYYYERDYDPDDAREFISWVEEYIVPLSEDVDKAAENWNIEYKELSESELEDCVAAVAEAVGGTMQKAYQFMFDYDLYDFKVSDNKTPMSYTTYIENYEAPYLLVSAAGDTSDVMTAVHEFGHYTDSFGNYNAYETIDLAEIFSQGLEYLSLSMLEDQLDKKSLKSIGREQVADTVDTFVQQCSFAEFERLVYSLPEEELTLENINAASLEVAERFGYSSEGWEDYYAASWIDIPHFFEAPFYVISYPVSLTAALQFYELESEEEGAGVAKYVEMLGHESGDLLETLEYYGLADPFDEDTVADIADLILDMLKEYK